MTRPTFVVDERAFEFAVLPNCSIEESLGEFVGLIEETIAFSGRSVELLDAAYSLVVNSSGDTLAALLGITPGASERDFLLRLLRVLGRCEVLNTNGPAMPVVVQASEWVTTLVSDGIARALDVYLRVGDYPAVLTSRARALPSGKVVLRRNGNIADAFIVVERTDLPLVYRSTITALDPSEEEFFLLAARGYPKLLFSPALSFGGFQLGYGVSRHLVCRHLEFLNDDFMRLAEEYHWDHARMMAAAAIPFSDESSATKKARRLLRQRDVTIRGVTVTCTLHTKLRPNMDRIHFHPPVKELDAAKIVIGLFVGHLET